MIRIIFLIFNEMFVLKKCILRLGTLVQELNLRVVLMFLVWMKDLNRTFPHPTSTRKHQTAVYFWVRCIAVPEWHLSDFCFVLNEKWFISNFWSLFTVWIHSPCSGMYGEETFLLEMADGVVLTAVASSSWASPSFCEEKHLSRGFLLWNKDNEYRQIWCFRINYCMIIVSNV